MLIFDFKHKKAIANGFSLIELMVAIAIVAILASLAAPSFNTFLERNRISSIISQFTGALVYARNEAVTRNRHVVVCQVADATIARPQCGSSSVWDNGWIIFVDDNINNQLDANENLLRVAGAVPVNYSILSQGKNTSWIAFNANGLPKFKGGALGATYAVTPPVGVSSPNSRLIIVDVTGRSRVTD